MCASVQGGGAQRLFVCGNARHVFHKYLLARAASCQDFGLLVVDISVAFMQVRIDEEIYVKVPSGIKSSGFCRLKAAWKEESIKALVRVLMRSHATSS